MGKFIKTIALAGAVALSAASGAVAQTAKPTIVLVHGAFAESASWNRVIADLTRDGFPVIAAANPLRSVSRDAEAVASVVTSIKGPVILVGHSYAGTVISAAAEGEPNVKGLVYVAAFAPDVGETSLELTGRFPGSTLGPALSPPVYLPGGGKDLYVRQDLFPGQFAADVARPAARVMAATQRPVTDAALTERSVRAAWKTIPSWFIYGTADRNIPPAAQVFMSTRAHARKTVAVTGASHLVMISHPREVTALIEEAAAAN